MVAQKGEKLLKAGETRADNEYQNQPILILEGKEAGFRAYRTQRSI